jgi:uncharacterized protein
MSLVPRNASVLALAVLGAGAITGCASTPPTHFHSLVAPPLRSGNAAAAMPATGVPFEILPVTVPVQVDLPQFVVRLPDDAMAVLEHERWIAPLGDEIRAAIALRVQQVLAVTAPAPAAATDRPWRVRLDVQRFDSTLARVASVQLLWSMQQAGSGTVLRCQASYEQAVAPGVAALAAGHRAVFERLGNVIGQAIQAAAAGGTPSCG